MCIDVGGSNVFGASHLPLTLVLGPLTLFFLYHLELPGPPILPALGIDNHQGKHVVAGLEPVELQAAAGRYRRCGSLLVELEPDGGASSTENLLEQPASRAFLPDFQFHGIRNGAQPFDLVIELHLFASLIGTERIEHYGVVGRAPPREVRATGAQDKITETKSSGARSPHPHAVSRQRQPSFIALLDCQAVLQGADWDRRADSADQ